MTRQRAVLYMLLAVVAAAAAVLSFSALRDLALVCGFDERLAWLLPVTVDAGAAAGSLAWLGTAAPAARTYGRVLAVALLASSVGGNALGHGLDAYRLRPAWWVVVGVSAIAPAVLGALVHLVVLVGRQTGAMEGAHLPPTADVVVLGGDPPADQASQPSLGEEEREEIAAAAGVPVHSRRVLNAQGPTHVYRLFGSADALLYVGITCWLATRLGDHKRTKAWWSEVVRVEVETFATRAEALAEECEAIDTESPLHNRHPGLRTEQLVRRAIVDEDRSGPTERLVHLVKDGEVGPAAEQPEPSADQARTDPHFDAVQSLADEMGQRPTRQAVRTLTGVGATRADRLRNAVLVRTIEVSGPADRESVRA